MDLGQEIERSLRRKGILRAASAAWVCQVANESFGELFSAKTFREGILTVSPKIPPARLSMESPRLILEINRKLGRNLVSKIRIRTDQ